jgi:tetratricopeptide (TPR) repeat protein
MLELAQLHALRRTMPLRRAPVILILILFGVCGANSQSRHRVFSIGGTVREDGTQRALENVQVTLKQLTGPVVNTTFTRANGDFQIDGLGDGDYVLEIAAKDYEPHREAVTLSEGSRLGIPVFLSKSGKAAGKSPLATLQMSISAHQLSVPHKAYEEFEKGMTLVYLKSDYRGGIAQFQLAIRDFPTYYEAYAEQGSAYYQLQDGKGAEEALRKSVELSSGQYADALFGLAALLTDTKRYGEAETTARQGISADSSSWRGPFELARALNGLKRPDEAEKSAQQARDIMPDNPPVYLLLANIHIQRKDYPALLRDLDDYLRLAPFGPDADQARKTRERVQASMNAAKDEAGGKKQDQDKEDTAQDEDDDDTDSDAASSTPKNTPARATEPDNSGLPSLPPAPPAK